MGVLPDGLRPHVLGAKAENMNHQAILEEIRHELLPLLSEGKVANYIPAELGCLWACGSPAPHSPTMPSACSMPPAMAIPPPALFCSDQMVNAESPDIGCWTPLVWAEAYLHHGIKPVSA